MNLSKKIRIMIICLALITISACSSCRMFEGFPVLNTESSVNAEPDESYAKTESKAVSDNSSKTASKSYTDVCYKHLTSDEKQVFDELRNGLLSFKTDIKFSKPVVSVDDYHLFYKAVVNSIPNEDFLDENSNYLYNDDNKITDVKPKYKCTKEQFEKKNKTLYAAADKVVANAKNYTAYDKIRYFHDYLIKKCTYTVTGADIYSAYGCLVNGKAVCEGYSKAFSILCQRAGIASVLVSGTATNNQGNTEGHMWNKVLFGKAWYNVDVTWDDMPGISKAVASYDYYFVNDEGFKANHTVEKNRFVKYPSASSMKANYYVRNKLYVSGDQDPVELFKTAAGQAVKNQSELITLKFKDLKQLESVYDYINADNSTFGDLLATRCHDYNAVIDFKNVSYATNNAMKIITVRIPFIKQ